jgi:hypothetical protein
MRIPRIQIQHRKAVGSIVGTAFFILILISGFYFYTLMNQGDAWQQKVFTDMRNFDIERSQEVITLDPKNKIVSREDDNLIIWLKNTGSRPLNISTVGFWDGSDEFNQFWVYSPNVEVLLPADIHNPARNVRLITGPEQGPGVFGLRVEPGESYRFKIITEGLAVNPPDGTYEIQFLTENGLLFIVSYP